jgi:hypothetical protein
MINLQQTVMKKYAFFFYLPLSFLKENDSLREKEKGEYTAHYIEYITTFELNEYHSFDFNYGIYY